MNTTGIHLYHMTTWQGTSGQWYCNDTTYMVGKSGKWYTPMRILQFSVEEYINFLLQYNAQNISYYEPTDCLTFSFNTQLEAKKFCRVINAAATKQQYYCC